MSLKHALPSGIGRTGKGLMIDLITKAFFPLMDHAIKDSSLPFDRPHLMRPHTDSLRYCWVHYGVMLPDLPEPHRLFNIMSLIGMTSMTCFDNDYMIIDSPRQTATLSLASALMRPHHVRGYSIARECEFRPDGSLLRFGEDLTISGHYPNYVVSGSSGDFSIQLQITCTDKVSWFTRSFLYEHLSLLSEYSGKIIHAGVTTPIKGLGTFEYAKSSGLYSLVSKTVPDAWKLPMEFFTYQIINLDARTQLLLVDTHGAGKTILKAAWIRSLDGYGRAWNRNVTFEVLEHQPEPALSPDKRAMRLPKRLRWIVQDAGQNLIEINGIVDTPFFFGLGRGYTSSYSYDGHYKGRPITGRAYIEYIDCE